MISFDSFHPSVRTLPNPSHTCSASLGESSPFIAGVLVEVASASGIASAIHRSSFGVVFGNTHGHHTKAGLVTLMK
jgi:hypothetical protein